MYMNRDDSQTINPNLMKTAPGLGVWMRNTGMERKAIGFI